MIGGGVSIIYGYSFLVAAVVAVIATEGMRRVALRWGVLDHPGGRKVQQQSVPLLGGAGVVLTIYGVVITHLVIFAVLDQFGMEFIRRFLHGALGVGGGLKLFGIMVGGVIVFALGLADDLRDLRPRTKLLGQIGAGLVLVLCDVRIELFVLSNPIVSSVVTIFWIVALTNAMNFIDNMDGLCGGVSLIAALSFFHCVVPFEPLVRLLLLVFAGALLGFLGHNLRPARIYMGDAGAQFCGYFLATVAVLGTFHVEGTPRLAVAAPLLALAVPLFDMISVMIIRWRMGAPLMRGDQRHFSHRLVDLGMRPPQAVAFIWLVAAIIGLGGALLPRLDGLGTLIILVQTSGLFLLIILLMKVGSGNGRS